LANELGSAIIYSDKDEMMARLRSGALDCVVVDNSIAAELASDSSDVRMLSDPLLEYDMRFAVAKENAELLNAINSAIEALGKNGTLKGLCDKYFSGMDYTYIPPENDIAREGSLSLAVSPDSPPFSYRNADGMLLGFDIEVAIAVCDFLGVELQIMEYDVWELVTAVWFGRVDLALGWLPGEEDEFINISDAYANAQLVIVVRK